MDGVLASDQSEWLLDDVVPARWTVHLPRLYCAIMAPLRWAYWTLGPTGIVALDTVLGIQYLGHRVPLITSRLPAVASGLLLAAVVSRAVQRARPLATTRI